MCGCEISAPILVDGIERIADGPVAELRLRSPRAARPSASGGRSAAIRRCSSRPCSRRSRPRRLRSDVRHVGQRPPNTSCGHLPPSSSRTRLRFDSADQARKRRPTSVEPVKATQSMSGWRPIASPTVSPGPVTTLRTPSGMPASAPSSAIRSRLQRRRRRRLDDDAVAGRQRRTELPGGHLRRVVPRHDRAHDADRLAGDRRDACLPATGRPGRRACRSPRRASGCRPRSRACQARPCR